MFQLVGGCIPIPLPAIDITQKQDRIRIVRQFGPRDRQLLPSVVIIKVTKVIMGRGGQMNFARIRLQLPRLVQGRLGQGQPRIRMIEAVEVKLVVDIGEPAKGKKKPGIARGRLLEKPFGFPQILDEIGIVDHAIDDRARFDIRFVILDVLRRTNLNRRFFLRSKTRL